MTRATSPRLRVYAALAATALLAALITGRPELAVLATPFALLVGVALAGAPLALDGELRLERDRALEGERLGATVTVINRGAPARVDVRLPAAGAWRPTRCRSASGSRAASGASCSFEVTVRHWGVHDAGPAVVHARDRLGATTLDGTLGEAAQVRVYAGAERLRRIVAPLLTRPVLGSQISGERGEGIEFADLRPFEAGRPRPQHQLARDGPPAGPRTSTSSTRSTARTSSCSSTPSRRREGTLDAAVRAAASLASSYLARRDRVALVSLGGELSWLTGSPGTRQLYRILDALFSSQVRPSFRWKGVTPRAAAAAGRRGRW